MRISDWSSDVCSSDLVHFRHSQVTALGADVGAQSRFLLNTECVQALLSVKLESFVLGSFLVASASAARFAGQLQLQVVDALFQLNSSLALFSELAGEFQIGRAHV